MYITQVCRQFAHRSFQSVVAQKNHTKNLIPTAILIAETLMPISAHAQRLDKSASHILEFDFMPNIVEKFIPKEFQHTQTKIPFLFGLQSLTPKNHFKKDSVCLMEKYNGSIEELDYFIETLLPKNLGEKSKNPMFGKGKSFYEIGEKHNINPSVLVAIAMHESGRGTSRAATTMKNIGGIFINNKHASFDNVDDCIESMATILEKQIRAKNFSIESIGKSGKYCDISASETWVKNVMFFLNRM